MTFLQVQYYWKRLHDRLQTIKEEHDKIRWSYGDSEVHIRKAFEEVFDADTEMWNYLFDYKNIKHNGFIILSQKKEK